jgi:pimeloyl-ACP methyl ester carboxylesterase
VFVAGHDWGAHAAWLLCLFRPDRVRAAVVLGVPYSARHAHARPITEAFAAFGEGFYINQFQVVLAHPMIFPLNHAIYFA